MQGSAAQYSAAQCSVVECSAVRYNAILYSAAPCSEVQHSVVEYSAVQCGTMRYCTVTYSAAQYSVVQWLPSAGLQHVLVCDRRWSSPFFRRVTLQRGLWKLCVTNNPAWIKSRNKDGQMGAGQCLGSE